MEYHRSPRRSRVPWDRTSPSQREEPYPTLVRLHVDVARRKQHNLNLLARNPRRFRIWSRIPTGSPHHHLLQPSQHHPRRLLLHFRPEARSPSADTLPILVLPLLPKLLPSHSEFNRMRWMEHDQLHHRRLDSQSCERRQSNEDPQRGRNCDHRHFGTCAELRWVPICACVREVLVDPGDNRLLHRFGIGCPVLRFRWMGGCSKQRHGCECPELWFRDRWIWIGMEFTRSGLYRQLPRRVSVISRRS